MQINIKDGMVISMGDIFLKLLNRRMAAVWLLAAATIACVVVGICFLTNPPKEYRIRITIPAGCTESFSYSDEEICPKSGTLTIYAEEGLGDTEIMLLPVESPNDAETSLLPGENQGDAANSSEPVYITSGMPVRFEVEKGTWYRIGVNVQNPADEDKNVYVSVKGVEVRIADRAETGAVGMDMAGMSAAQADETGANGVGVGRVEADGTGAGSAGTGGTNSDGEGVGADGTDSAEAAGSTDEEYIPQRHDLGDLDGNGVPEYLLITFLPDNLEYAGHLNFCFNGELIYDYDDILMMSPGEAEYIDLDRDGEKEIFFTFYPWVNSMPLIEYAVLKQADSGWKALEMIHEGTMLDNAFPISSRYGNADNTIVIACEGIEKEITYNIKNHYENQIEEFRDSVFYEEFVEILNGNRYKEGDIFGGTAAWGIWEICSGIYDGRNCLIATHCLEGPRGKYDMIGLVDIYFDYNEKGLVNILDMEFRDVF